MEELKGDIIVDSNGIANELNNYFHSVYTADKEEEISTNEVSSHSEIDKLVVNRQDVESRLFKLDGSKSIGVDMVHPLVLKNCSSAISNPLYLIHKKSIETGTLPDAWKEANVTAIFKKGSRLKSSYYRPVSLTSIPCKMLERIIADHIMKHLIANKLLCEEQHGYRKGRVAQQIF